MKINFARHQHDTERIQKDPARVVAVDSCFAIIVFSVLCSFGVVFTSCKVNFHEVRPALQNSVCLLCILLPFRSSPVDPTFCGIFVYGPLQSILLTNLSERLTSSRNKTLPDRRKGAIHLAESPSTTDNFSRHKHFGLPSRLNSVKARQIKACGSAVVSFWLRQRSHDNFILNFFP